MTKKTSFYTDKQVVAPLLCAECEDLLNQNGEKWVLGQCYRGTGRFRLLQELQAVTPLHKLPEAAAYDGNAATSGNVGKLVYFAASVVWRAGARVWQMDEQKLTEINLGTTYGEELRKFVYGTGSFPTNAVVVVHVNEVCKYEPNLLFPYGGRTDDCFKYRFAIPGIVFDLYLGQQAPNRFGKVCVLRSQGNLVFLSKRIEQDVLDSSVKAFGGSRPAGKLATGTRTNPIEIKNLAEN